MGGAELVTALSVQEGYKPNEKDWAWKRCNKLAVELRSMNTTAMLAG